MLKIILLWLECKMSSSDLGVLSSCSAVSEVLGPLRPVAYLIEVAEDWPYL